MIPQRSTYLLSHSSERSRHVGFTLIELIAVIAIVLVLAALLAPLGTKLRYKAALAGCTQNMRSVGIGLASYANENDNKYPPTWSPPWTAFLIDGGYVSDPKVFLCPADTINKVGPDPITGKNDKRSYSYCGPVMTANTNDPTAQLNRNLIKEPTRQYLISEWHAVDFSLGGDGKPIGGLIRNAGPSNMVSPTHSKGSNVLFADGHVEFRDQKFLTDSYAGWILNDIRHGR